MIIIGNVSVVGRLVHLLLCSYCLPDSSVVNNGLIAFSSGKDWFSCSQLQISAHFNPFQRS
jgi:hypothetical protein